MDAYFTGSIPTDAGGADDNAGWGELVIHGSCGWRRVDVDLDARGIEVWRTEAGDVVWTHLEVVDQCGANLSVFRSSGERQVDLLHRFEVSRNLGGVCPMLRKVEPMLVRHGSDRKPGLLIGFQAFSRSDEDAPWSPGPALSFVGGRLVPSP